VKLPFGRSTPKLFIPDEYRPERGINDLQGIGALLLAMTPGFGAFQNGAKLKRTGGAPFLTIPGGIVPIFGRNRGVSLG
jgi:hypothetical protein